MAKQFDAKEIRIAAFDLDGTVLNEGVMSPAVEKALHDLASTGVAVTVSTSRDISQIPLNVLDCFEYRITANGSNVSDRSGNVLMDIPMDPKTAMEALRILHKCKGRSCSYFNGFVLASPGFLLRLLRRTNYLSKSHRKTTKSVRKGGISLRMRRYVKKRKRGVYRIQTFFKSFEEAKAAAEKLSSTGKYTPVLIQDASIETTLKGVTKANGLLELCKALGYGPQNIVSFGDSANDLEMIRISGYSVGMGNAEDCVKEQVDYITDSVADDGIANAIKKLFGF